MRLLTCLVLAGCGRIGFGPLGGDDGATASYVAEVLADQPLAYYRFGESSGTVAADSSGHHNDAAYDAFGGTLTLGVTGALAGDTDTAVTLSGDGNSGAGTTAYVDIPPGAFAFGGDFTVEAWVRPSQPPASFNDAFFIWEVYNTSGFRSGWEATMTPVIWFSESGGGSPGVKAPSPFASGAWHHLAVSRTGSTFTLFVDGADAASGAPAYVTPPAAAQSKSLGANEGLPASATYDELAIYDRALEPARIAAHYDAGRR